MFISTVVFWVFLIPEFGRREWFSQEIYIAFLFYPPLSVPSSRPYIYSTNCIPQSHIWLERAFSDIFSLKRQTLGHLLVLLTIWYQKYIQSSLRNSFFIIELNSSLHLKCLAWCLRYIESWDYLGLHLTQHWTLNYSEMFMIKCMAISLMDTQVRPVVHCKWFQNQALYCFD